MMKPIPYTAVIWDWNGTLLNDARACCAIMNDVLRRHRAPPLSYARYQDIFDFPVQRYYEMLGFDFRRTPFEQVGTEFITRYERRRSRLRLQPGARSLLDALQRHGVTQVVLSAYRQETLETLIAEKRLRQVFHHLSGANNHYAEGKIEQGVRLIKELGLNPSVTLMVGDTRHDWEVARAMGVDCVLLDAGHQSRQRLVACGVPLFDDLPAFGRWLFSGGSPCADA